MRRVCRGNSDFGFTHHILMLGLPESASCPWDAAKDLPASGCKPLHIAAFGLK
jgi:hypothetical protein